MVNFRFFSQKFVLPSLLYLITEYQVFVVNANNAHGWEPSVSLAADVDEPQQWGFCLDLWGAGSILTCEELQARSCKEFGGDTQFEYHLPTKAIRSYNYDFNCEANSDPSTRGCVMVAPSKPFESGSSLDVGLCDPTDERQIFELVESEDDYELHIGEDLCLAVSDTSLRPAEFAPPLARKRFLTVTTCSTLPGEQKTWTISPRPSNETSTTVVPTAGSEVTETASSTADALVLHHYTFILSLVFSFFHLF